MRLGQAAVHAGMAGKTALVVARWHNSYVHLPVGVATSSADERLTPAVIFGCRFSSRRASRRAFIEPKARPHRTLRPIANHGLRGLVNLFPARHGTLRAGTG